MDGLPLRYARTRLFPRAKVDLRVIVTRSAAGKSMLCTARTRDIGEGGMCLLMAMELAVDDEIWVDFTLDSVRVYAQARVRYRSGFQYGVQFMTLSSQQREAIRAICNVAETATAL